MPEVKPTVGDSSWFTHDRFGLFIHWGIYALPARHEWVKQREEIPDEEYRKYFEHFDPDLYDPDEWAEAASNAGMKYFVVTTKHHDGFCLWGTDQTDYKVTNTPYGQDLIAPMVEAFRSRDMGVGFYHSLIDWHHPQFVIDDVHSMRNHPDRDELNESRDQSQYREYLHAQTRELMTRFGDIDIMFFDFSYPPGPNRPEGFEGKGRDDWGSEKLLEIVRSEQPDCLVNDRLDLMDVEGGWDYKTPEQVVSREPVKVDGERVVWETCQTFSGSWGYHREEASWKSVKQLLTILIDTVSKDGNLLLNVGPTGRGEFDYRALDRLQGMGEWMKRHDRSIYGCTDAPEQFPTPQDCRLTYNPDSHRIYVHVMNWPFKHLPLDGFAGNVEYAQLLDDASEIPFSEPDEGHDAVLLELPVRQPAAEIPVIELYMK